MKTLPCALGAIVASGASAQLITPGMYALSNHPDGGVAEPFYGLRLDELTDATSGHDRFTFDFDHDASNMVLDYDGSTIRIFGQAFGGRDIGSEYADDEHRGVYQIDFTYDVGVGFADADDDVIVDNSGNMTNFGTIVRPNGESVDLWSKSNDSYTFRFGDEDNDQGHRGFDGISGWGWLNHTVADQHVSASDWLFTARAMVPTPATASLAIAGGALAARRRKLR